MTKLVAPGAVLILGCIAVPAVATVLTLFPIQDSYVSSRNPTTNYGDDISLYLGWSNEPVTQDWRTYLQFDLSQVEGILRHAELRLFQYATGHAAGGIPMSLYRVLDPWQEGTITWANQVPYANGVIWREDAGGSFEIGTWVIWVVTPLVRGWMLGTWPNQGMVLKNDDVGLGAARYGVFYSSEYANELLRARLLIVTEDSASIAGEAMPGSPALTVMPNPVRGVARFALGPTVPISILDICDSHGRVVERLAGRGRHWEWTPGDGTPTGVYFVKPEAAPAGVPAVKFLYLR